MMKGVAVPNMAPTPRDLCAVAINIAARMSYRIYCAWQDETNPSAEPEVEWEKLSQEQRANAVGFVMYLIDNPRVTLSDIHDMAVETAGHRMPPETCVPYELCPAQYCVSLELSVVSVRAIVNNLAPRSDMIEYMRALDNGTDEFMLEN